MIGAPTLRLPGPLWKRALPWAAVILLLTVLALLAQTQPAVATRFPAEWNLHLRVPIDAFQSWVIGHRVTHPVFTLFFDPLSAVIDYGLRALENFLLALPWFVIMAAFGLLGYWLGGWRLVAWAVLGLLFMGLVGLWTESMQTLALMGVSVFISLLVGIPLGILAARSDTFDAMLRPILDGMQTMPAFVYLIPVLLFFGVARVPSVVATVIYALPPAIRLTNLGIRQVSPQAIEAARSFGSTPRQMLLKVQLPLALPSVMAGVNQTIMMALGIVVIAALIGAGGLGREVMVSLQRLKVGRAVEAGLAIVFLAILLDRLSDALSKLDLTGIDRRRERRLPAGIAEALQLPARALGALAAAVARLVGKPAQAKATAAALERYAYLVNSLLIITVMLGVNAVMLHTTLFPAGWTAPLQQPVDAAVGWMRDNLYQIGNLPIGTGPLSDFMTLQLLNPLRTLLVSVLPWPVFVIGAMALAFYAAGWQLALSAGIGMVLVGLLGMWELSMDTLSQVIVAVVFTVALALPLGIITARSDRMQTILRPLLDTLQTIPSFVFLVPVIMLFNVGRVPGLIASVLYALPPGIKLIDLGIRQVAPETVEAAEAFGSTPWQTLAKVQLPLALPSLMLGVNQIIMMVLAMVVIAGLVGGGGLGLEAVTGLAKNQTGRGIEAGLAIVILAIIIDRITQGLAAKER